MREVNDHMRKIFAAVFAVALLAAAVPIAANAGKPTPPPCGGCP